MEMMHKMKYDQAERRLKQIERRLEKLADSFQRNSAFWERTYNMRDDLRMLLDDVIVAKENWHDK